MVTFHVLGTMSESSQFGLRPVTWYAQAVSADLDVTVACEKRLAMTP
jgi:hypothetical protein